MLRLLFAAAVVLMAPLASAAQVDDDVAVKIATPRETIAAGDLDSVKLAELKVAADAFYGFWNNGSQDLLDKAISKDFVDHTLPSGRPQGPSGPAAASKQFLAAVPDLKTEVVQRIIVGDRVVSHLHFSGHFTGTFMSKQGSGEKIDFIATDILRIVDGKITDNWHIEDNLTFLQQVGVIQ